MGNPRETASSRLSRRDTIKSLALAGLGQALTAPARAQTPIAIQHHVTIGELEVTVLSDGHMLQATSIFGTDRTDAERAAAWKTAGVTAESVRAAVNVTLVKRGSEFTLIDVGAGPNFMATTGKLTDSLAAAGIDPKAITAVIFTHGHPDHLWGAVDEFDDSPRFPNARYLISEAEWALWMTGDPTAKLPADRQNFIPGAKRNLGFLKDRMTLIKPNAAIAPGIAAIDTAGHTQGHIAVALSSGNASAIVLADALIHPHISFVHPAWKLAADHEPDRAAVTRQALLDRLAAGKTPIIAYHLPFPGLGHVEKRGLAYAFAAT